MSSNLDSSARRILLVDDNPAIHRDFQKIFAPRRAGAAALAATEAAVFGTAQGGSARRSFDIDSALQGQQGVQLVRKALDEKRPYAMAFVDVRMPPGWDGIETITQLWKVDPDVQIVICTAYSDYSWEETLEKLGHADQFIVLKKPFDNIEVLQLAEALTEKWRLARQERNRFQRLEEKIRERNRDMEAIRDFNAQLDAANRSRSTTRRPAQNPDSRDRVALEQDLRRALQTGELTVHYQPLVEIASRRVASLEALVRWPHPQAGPIPPSEFIPLAEETGLIIPLGEYVLRSVCEQLVSWQREGVPVVRTAVNLSAVQLEQQSMDKVVRGMLKETGLQPHQLALELTESTFMGNVKDYARALQGLRDDGVHIEIDDFGTGYSSLSYLKQLPVDTMKIDRSFISNLDTNSTDETIVGAILALARGLGLRVVAEGVETPGQLQVLGKHGCEFAQGYYFSRPLPALECRKLLLELAQRTSFTDTLRLRIIRPGDGQAVPEIVEDAARPRES
jgi:EAL domain-containing protein (putative c-di-GMP-specific phosphodiesterase class I)/CheY-like chemotaxis protein